MKNIIRQYLGGLQSGDEKTVTRLFTGGAMVHSPLYGDVPAKKFFKRLFADTYQSEITLLNIFNSPDQPELYAAHFRYEWILKNGAVNNFECMDIFRFAGSGKIKELTIIYDTWKTRDNLKNAGLI